MNKLSNYKTTVMCTNGRITVVYCATAIVEATPDEITLSTGGWRTVTTKREMQQASNQFGLGYSVFQKDHEWFVRLGGWGPAGRTIAFDHESVTFARKDAA